MVVDDYIDYRAYFRLQNSWTAEDVSVETTRLDLDTSSWAVT